MIIMILLYSQFESDRRQFDLYAFCSYLISAVLAYRRVFVVIHLSRAPQTLNAWEQPFIKNRTRPSQWHLYTYRLHIYILSSTRYCNSNIPTSASAVISWYTPRSVVVNKIAVTPLRLWHTRSVYNMYTYRVRGAINIIVIRRGKKNAK